jgi:23S rRNA-/tRNA-specific pseudouridylate synthase
MTASREKIWVVRAGDGKTAADIVQRMGEEPARAIEAGRVFVGKKRATRPEQPVRVGDTVRIGAGPRRLDAPSPAIEVLFEKDGLVACVKPAGLPTVADHVGASHALVTLVAKTLGTKPTDLRVTSRLDRDVSGVVVFALDARAEERLRAARSEGTYHRRYVALTSRPLPEPEGIWSAPIGRAARPHLRAARGPDAKAAVTRWAMVAIASPSASSTYAMLAVDPVTGRTHQIRVHASDAGAPLIGDRDYGGAKSITLPNGRVLAPTRIALHAARVVVPGLRGPLEAIAMAPAELEDLWAALGGAPEAWNRALSCETPAPPDP